MSKPQALFAKYEALLPILAAVCEFERRRHASRNESEFPGLRWISDSAGCQPCQTSAPPLGLGKNLAQRVLAPFHDFHRSHWVD